MIGFENNSPFTEGVLDDVLGAAKIKGDEIKQVWDGLSSPEDANKVLNYRDEEFHAGKKKPNEDGVLTKLSDALSGANDKALKSPNYINRKSIIARSKNSVMQFPIYITQTIRVNEAHIISKLFERVYASLFQSVLAMNPFIDDSREVNNLVFLKNFHTNINESAEFELYNEFYTPIDELDAIMKESVFYKEQITPTMEVCFRAIPCTNTFLISESARLNSDALQGFSYLTEATDTTKESTETNASWKTLSEDDIRRMAIEEANISKDTVELANIANGGAKEIHDRAIKDADLNATEARVYGMTTDQLRKEAIASLSKNATDDEIDKKVSDLDTVRTAASNKVKQAEVDLRNDIRAAVNEINDAENKLKQKFRDANEKDGFKYKNGRFLIKEQSKKVSKTIQNGPKKADDITKDIAAPKLLRDADIKKINGMLPYTIEATFRIREDTDEKDNKTGFSRDVHFIIGIKSNLHLIRSQDLSEDLRELVTGNIRSLQKVRYKTGEITFMDYMFNAKGVKADASKGINYNKRWISTLKRLAEWEKINGSMLHKPAELLRGDADVPIPNATLILAQTDVTTMMNQTGIDLSIISNAKRLCKSLFLIAICIVDSSAGTMRVLFPDSANDWDVQSLAAIDAELAKTDNSQLMKELQRMVNH